MYTYRTNGPSRAWMLAVCAAVAAACGAEPDTDPRVLSARFGPSPTTAEVGWPAAPPPAVSTRGAPTGRAAPSAEPAAPRDVSPVIQPTAAVVGRNAAASIDPALRHAFAEAAPETPVQYAAAGDREAVELLLVGRAEFGLIGGALSARETQAGLRMTTLGVELFAVAVPAASPVRSITRRQLRALFTGETVDWAPLGGGNVAVVPVVPHDQALANRAAATLIPGDAFAAGCVRADGPNAVAEQLRQHPGAIAVVRVGNGPLPADQKLLQIDWVPPTTEAFGYGTYPFGIPLQLVTSGAARGAAARFVEFARSAPGRELLRRTLVAVP